MLKLKTCHFKKKNQLFLLPSIFLILTCNHGGQKNYLLHIKSQICTESQDLKSQGLMRNYQASSQQWAPGIAVSITLQSHMHPCGSLSRTTDIVGWLPARFCKKYLKSNVWNKKTPWDLPCTGWLPSEQQSCQHELGGGSWRAGQESSWAGTKSGTNGFESLGSVIKNWLKISWSILLSLQKIFSLQICGQFIKKKKRNCNLFSQRPSHNKPIKSGEFGIMMFR